MHIKIEFDITKKYLDEFIQGGQLEIFDIGGGPGRYSIYLAQKGHTVTLLDLSEKNIAVAKEKVAEAKVALYDIVQGDVLKLDTYEVEKYDVVLLMGPLYHLLDESDRKKAVEGAIKLLKPQGIIIVSFISKYALIQDILMNLGKIPDGIVEEALGCLEDGRLLQCKGFTTAYFTDIKEAKELMKECGSEQLVFAAVENILGSRELEINTLPEEDYQKLLKLGYALSQDENVIGCGQHFLYIGRKGS